MSRRILQDPEIAGDEMLAAERAWPRYTDVKDQELRLFGLEVAAPCREVGGTS